MSRKKLNFGLSVALLFQLDFFGFMTTHFGDQGLGDSARVPVGHFREIQEINGTQAYIQDVDNGIYALDIDSFYIADDFVYGLTGSHNENYKGN